MGLDNTKICNLIYTHDAVSFAVNDTGKILEDSISFDYLFYPSIRYNNADNSFQEKICYNSNVTLDFVPREILFYNPQRHDWIGFSRLISHLKDAEMEYFIGDNSPIRPAIFFNETNMAKLPLKNDGPDIEGTHQVNLLLSGSNFSILCLIDDSCVESVICAVYLQITGKPLALSRNTINHHKSLWIRLKNAFKSPPATIYDKFSFPKKLNEKRSYPWKY